MREINNSPTHLISFILAVAIVHSIGLAAATLSVDDFVRSSGPVQSESPSSAAFSFYDEFISPIDGERCQMHPSCSHYSRQALQQKGWLQGALMSFDRLMRCGYDLKTYQVLYQGQRQLYQDPVKGDGHEN